MIDRKTELVALIAAQLFDLDGMTPALAAEQALQILEAAGEKVRESDGLERDFEALIAAAVRVVEVYGSYADPFPAIPISRSIRELEATLIALNEIPDPQSVESKA